MSPGFTSGGVTSNWSAAGCGGSCGGSKPFGTFSPFLIGPMAVVAAAWNGRPPGAGGAVTGGCVTGGSVAAGWVATGATVPGGAVTGGGGA